MKETMMAMTADRPARPKRPFRLNGWHVLGALLGFFGVMLTANGILVYLALTTFPGTVVESSYEAGRAYPGVIASARAQAQREWSVDLQTGRAADGTVAVVFEPHDKAGNPITGLAVDLRLEHPATKAADHRALLTEVEAGRYVGTVVDVTPGNWNVAVAANRGDETVFMTRNRVFLSANP